MVRIKYRSVGVCRHFLVVACFCWFGGGVVTAQTVRIIDADVNLADLVGVSENREPLESSQVVKSQLRGRRLVKLTSYRRSAEEAVLRDAIIKESQRYGIDPDLVFALVGQESGFRLNAVSPKNARGPLQLMPGTAARFGVRNPHDAREAVRGGVAYLVWLLDRYKGNVSLALAGYNAGEGSVDAYLYGRTIVLRTGKVLNRGRIMVPNGIPPYAETRNYVSRIADRYRALRASRASRVGKAGN